MVERFGTDASAMTSGLSRSASTYAAVVAAVGVWFADEA